MLIEPKILGLNQKTNKNRMRNLLMKKKIFVIGIILLIVISTMGCVQYAKPDLCEKISSQETKEECYWESATINKDILLCEKIGNLQNRDLCYKDIATGSQHWTNAID